MVLTTLRNPSEVRGTGEYFGNIPYGDPDPEMLDLAQKLIEQKVKPFNPKEYEDRYEVALMAMIREKLKGHNPIVASAPERGNVINLMDALKASLGEAKPAAKSKPKAEPAVAKESPTKVSLKAALDASKAAAPKAAPKKKA
jgi:DNA end-binding protein Ku